MELPSLIMTLICKCTDIIIIKDKNVHQQLLSSEIWEFGVTHAALYQWFGN